LDKKNETQWQRRRVEQLKCSKKFFYSSFCKNGLPLETFGLDIFTTISLTDHFGTNDDDSSVIHFSLEFLPQLYFFTAAPTARNYSLQSYYNYYSFFVYKGRYFHTTLLLRLLTKDWLFNGQATVWYKINFYRRITFKFTV